MAHAYAVKRRTTPWDALLDEVAALSGQVAFLDQKIGHVANIMDDDWLVSAEGLRWVEMRRDRGLLLAKVSKAAIDAGIAETLLKRVELQGELMHRAAVEGIERAARSLGLPLTDEQQLEIVASIARSVVRLEEEEATKELARATSLDGEVE